MGISARARISETLERIPTKEKSRGLRIFRPAHPVSWRGEKSFNVAGQRMESSSLVRVTEKKGL